MEQPLGGLWEPGGSVRRFHPMDMNAALLVVLIAGVILAASPAGIMNALNGRRRDEDSETDQWN